MRDIKKRALLVGLLVGAMLGLITQVGAKKKEKPLTFKAIMQMLDSRVHQLTTGMMTENYKLIQDAATFIAGHPRPSLQERKRLMQALGPDIRHFKRIDKSVHSSAHLIVEAAKKKEMNQVLSHYKVVVTGCISCHQLIRPRFRKNVTK